MALSDFNWERERDKFRDLGQGSETRIHDQKTHALLYDILRELKKLNFAMSEIIGETLDDRDFK